MPRGLQDPSCWTRISQRSPSPCKSSIIRTDRLFLWWLFRIAYNPHDSSSSSCSLLRVVKAAGKVNPAVVFHVLPSQINPLFLFHGSWINRLIGDALLFLTPESRHHAVVFISLLRTWTFQLLSSQSTTLNPSVGFVCVHVRLPELRLHQRRFLFFFQHTIFIIFPPWHRKRSPWKRDFLFGSRGEEEKKHKAGSSVCSDKG